jgi:hypothetical protein
MSSFDDLEIRKTSLYERVLVVVYVVLWVVFVCMFLTFLKLVNER